MAGIAESDLLPVEMQERLVGRGTKRQKDAQLVKTDLGISPKNIKIKKMHEAAKMKSFKKIKNLFETKHQQHSGLELASPPSTITNLFNAGINPEVCASQSGEDVK